MQENTLPPVAAPTSPPLPGQRILVVEDDGIMRRLNTELLLRAGYQVDAAEDGAVAWDALQADRYDLMVTDHNMPKVTGVELLKMLHNTGMALPVIMASGTMPEREFLHHPVLQPSATLLKPYTADELLDTVERVLRATAEALVPVASRPQWRSAPSGVAWQLS
jgi:CheY-like chemotaxis protein